MTTPRPIRPHKGGRTARAPEARIRPQTLDNIWATLHEQGTTWGDWLEEEFSGEDIIMDKYVYGWYRYKDGKEIQFRYPASKESNLKQDGRRVTVEVTQGGNKWESRKGIVAFGGGNFIVTPA